ncbi:MAG: phytase [Cellvibrio sp.]|uniref:phytase n=1 Tax=Cellvibrio sp. TaxID=1965322 RepID=UPI0031ABCD74
MNKTNIIFAALTSAVVSISAVQAAPTPVATMGNNFSAAAIAPLNEGKSTSYLAVDESAGIRWLDAKGKTLAHLNQPAELLDSRLSVVVNEKGESKSLTVGATVFLPEQQPGLVVLDSATKKVRELLRLPIPSFKIENLCLSRDIANNLSIYLLDERGTAEHWLLLDAKGNQRIRHLRNLPISPNSKSCAVDDQQNLLFIAEESIGVWAYGADVETAPGRRAVDMAAPFGKLIGGAEVIATIPQGLLAIEPEQKNLMVYRTANNQFVLQQTISLAGLEEPEGVSAQYNATTKKIDAFIYDEESSQQQHVQFDWDYSAPVAKTEFPIVPVTASVQTQVMARFGDAADDPAIWVNKKDATKSRVIGTNKQQGLFVYDMQGREVQHFNTGKLNNVDVRYSVSFGKKVVDVAVATNRDDNSLAIYTIDPDSGELAFSGSVATNLEEIYGFCLYQSPANAKNPNGILYAIPNAKSGEFQQIQLSATNTSANKAPWKGKKVRSFFVKSQPEGCVADDKNQRLFVGEEDVAVWTIGAEPNAGTNVELVMQAGDVLVADIEGMGIYQGKKGNYLVVSSQGNNSYVILDAVAPFKVRGIIRVDMDAELGVDGVSETDGLEVTHFNLGGEFTEGMLVVQDGHKVMPEAPQNFKYVSWEKIRTALGLE